MAVGVCFCQDKYINKTIKSYPRWKTILCRTIYSLLGIMNEFLYLYYNITTPPNFNSVIHPTH